MLSFLSFFFLCSHWSSLISRKGRWSWSWWSQSSAKREREKNLLFTRDRKDTDRNCRLSTYWQSRRQIMERWWKKDGGQFELQWWRRALLIITKNKEQHFYSRLLIIPNNNLVTVIITKIQINAKKKKIVKL